ncbi:MAG: 8-oxo-dGTP diphosphatase MutT [Verrucomicrobia bacterium]|nr:8-oxo-dGTP diphosphatase MutT [Verrucomicrobiota bacterium]
MNAIEVSAALLFRDGKLLITQRRPQDHLGGLWEFPGGKRELNETFEQCLARELREELGIEAQVCELVEIITHAYPEKTVHLRFFRCALKAESAEPRALHCHALAWVSADELDRYDFPAADAQLLSHLKSSPVLWE